MFAKLAKRTDRTGTEALLLQVVTTKRVRGKMQDHVYCTIGRVDHLSDLERARAVNHLNETLERVRPVRMKQTDPEDQILKGYRFVGA